LKRFISILALAFLFSIVQPGLRPGSASAGKETWLSVRSKHFLLVGNASEKDIRKVGVRLEQFRDVFSRIFTRSKANSAIPSAAEPVRRGAPTPGAGGRSEFAESPRALLLRLHALPRNFQRRTVGYQSAGGQSEDDESGAGQRDTTRA
jgi:hypothetical protein